MKNFGLIISLLFSGLLLTGCNKTVVENCGDDCINESDIDVLEHKCMEYVNKALFDNIEKTPNPTVQYFYDNSGSMEYTFTDAEFSGTYYGIKGYTKAGDKSQNFICNIYTGGGLHDLYFYNDKSNNEEPVTEEAKLNEKLENLNNIVDINNSIGIIHDVENGTITLDNGEESITIMDKNLGTDVAGTGEESYGYYFQRGNNHGFQLNSEIKTGKDLVTRDVALQYGPDNWYDSDVQFVIMDNSEEVNRNLNLGNYFLAAVNDNLRGGSGDSEVVNRMGEYVIDQFRGDTGNPRTERKGPCPEGFHVPSFGEIHKLFKLWIDIKYPNDIEKKEHVRWMAIGDRGISTEFGNDLLLPRAGGIRFDGKATPHNQGSIGYYWMSSPGRFLSFDNNGIVEYSESYRAATFSVRCFKD